MITNDHSPSLEHVWESEREEKRTSENSKSL